MSATRTAAQQAASRANGARSHGPTTKVGKARSAQNGTKHGLRGGPFALLPDEDHEEFAALHAAVTSDWGPRDAYERRWVMELVASMWRQDRLRGLELATLTAAAEETPPSEATVRKLGTFARYGARIDKDIGRALQALRVLRDRPDDWIDELQDGTHEPEAAEPPREDRPDTSSSRTFEPGVQAPHVQERMSELLAHLLEREPANDTPEPGLPARNRRQRRALAALARKPSAA